MRINRGIKSHKKLCVVEDKHKSAGNLRGPDFGITLDSYFGGRT